MKMLTETTDIDSLLDEQRRLWLAGQRPDIEDFLRGTKLATCQDAKLDLLYHEIVLREQAGEQPTAEEYCTRFPQMAAELALQFEVHRALADPVFAETVRPASADSLPGAERSRSAKSASAPNHEIQREIGRGGSAVVYQARHRQLQRDVALKMFQPDRVPTSRELLRFQAEAAAVARLNHPHIVQIFEIGECDGAPFLTMELAEGGTLAQRLLKTTLTPAAAAELIEDLALAVQHAHDRQVIHRDLKPANVLFTKEGEPKVADFGLAKILADDLELKRDATRTGEPLGTPRYMSPEQASGEQDKIGPLTDVYALGTLLYECLTGQAPFVATSVVDTLQKIRNDEPRPPNRLQPGIPRDLVTICLHCLHKDPSRRYISAGAMAADLAKFRAGKPINARPVSTWERIWKWSLRRPAAAALIALLSLLLMGTAGVAIRAEYQERQRLAEVRAELAALMQRGQAAMHEKDLHAAQQQFAAAWRIVQAEPNLYDHLPGVAGWLDHSQRAASIELWQGRVPPREYEERRDDAIVDSLLLEPTPPEPIQLAREAIALARELTLPNDPAWKTEREFLAIVEAELLAKDQGEQSALRFLESEPFNSRLYLDRKRQWLLRSGNESAAAALEEQLREFPPDEIGNSLLDGIDLLRQQKFGSAEEKFAKVLAAEPAHFNARLLQAICFVRLQRLPEAHVALTACIAQRPTFPWSYYWRGVAQQSAGKHDAAEIDFRRVTLLKPSATLQFAVERMMTQSEKLPLDSDSVHGE